MKMNNVLKAFIAQNAYYLQNFEDSIHIFKEMQFLKAFVLQIILGKILFDSSCLGAENDNW